MLHPHMHEGGLRRSLLSTLVIIGMIFGCTISTVVAIDLTCSYNINTWMPIYPDAEQVSVEHDYFRPRAMGQTFMVLRTPDEPNVVNDWYLSLRVDLTQANVNRGIATTRYSTEPDPESDQTLIFLMSDCASN